MCRKLLGVAFLLPLLMAPALGWADDEHPEILLWADGAPDFEKRKDEKEVKKTQKSGEYSVANVHNPSLTVFLPPKEKATRTAEGWYLPGGGAVSAGFVVGT